jgi:hypothetical protein
MTTTHKHRMRVGANFDANVLAIQQGLADLPKTYMSRVFGAPGAGIPSWTSPLVGALVKGGVKVHKSFKDWDEQAILADMDWIPTAASSAVYTYHHEPQDDYANAAEYVQRCQRLYQLAKAHPDRARIRVVPILNWWPSAMGGKDWHAWWGPDMGDAMSWDVYSNTLSNYVRASTALELPIVAAAEVGLPLWVSELGSIRTTKDTTGAGCAAWMTDMLTGLAEAKCERVLWWSAKGGMDKTGKVKDMRLRARSPELAVWEKWTADQ